MGTTATKPEVRSISFLDEMILALIAGLKTQTRRAIKPQPPARDFKGLPHALRQGGAGVWDEYGPLGYERSRYCPYGKPGDLLWVREAHWRDRREADMVIYDATPEWGKYQHSPEAVRSTHPDESYTTRDEARRAMLPKFWSKIPSIHLPRWASRLTLELTDVRVQCVQEISEEDARAEGFPLPDGMAVNVVVEEIGGEITRQPGRVWDFKGVDGFRRYWNALYGPDAWDRNPWVWALTFAVHQCNIDTLLKQRGQA